MGRTNDYKGFVLVGWASELFSTVLKELHAHSSRKAKISTLSSITSNEMKQDKKTATGVRSQKRS
jgi:hypothetical protein